MVDRKLMPELERLYRERFRTFLRVAAAITGDEQSGSDAVQDAFVRAIDHSRSFRGEGSLEAWVWRIVLNAARARRLKAGGSGPHTLDEGEWFVSRTSDELGVRRWIASLPERQRDAVFLRYFADLDYRAIATALGIEIGTVSATLSAAHASLRRSMQEVSS